MLRSLSSITVSCEFENLSPHLSVQAQDSNYVWIWNSYLAQPLAICSQSSFLWPAHQSIFARYQFLTLVSHSSPLKLLILLPGCHPVVSWHSTGPSLLWRMGAPPRVSLALGASADQISLPPTKPVLYHPLHFALLQLLSHLPYSLSFAFCSSAPQFSHFLPTQHSVLQLVLGSSSCSHLPSNLPSEHFYFMKSSWWKKIPLKFSQTLMH